MSLSPVKENVMMLGSGFHCSKRDCPQVKDFMAEGNQRHTPGIIWPLQPHLLDVVWPESRFF
jgi:hypothetical protein